MSPTMQNVFEFQSGQWTLGVAVLTAVVVLWIASIRSDGPIYDHFPRVGHRGVLAYFQKPIHELVQEGYDRYTKPEGKPFVVHWWAKDYLIMPPKYMQDLREAGSDHLSFFKNITDALFLRMTVGGLYQSNRMVTIVKKELSGRMPALTAALTDEMLYSFRKEIGEANEWTIIQAQEVIGAIAHRTASRVLVGEEICRSDKFIRESQGFVMSIFITALVIVKLPLGIFRPVFAWVATRLHQMRLEKCIKMLQPIVEKRLKSFNPEDAASHNDAIDWTLGLDPPQQHTDSRVITMELMHNLWAGTSSPGALATDMLYQVLLFPQYLKPLREEAATALNESSGIWTEKVFNGLPLMDSFMRETSRANPVGSTTCSRTVQSKDFVFSDGLRLPPGTRISWPIKAMMNDQDEMFDGFRFARLAEADPMSSSKWRAATMGTSNLSWGYGNHVCPGRYFAVREVKMIFATLITGYDFEWVGQVKEKPPPMPIEGQFLPNMKQKIRIRRRV